MVVNFVYDGDGRRVKSTVNGTTTYFIGAHYELTGSQVTKYYFAGTQRAAMRKYTVPKAMAVEYLVSIGYATQPGAWATTWVRPASQLTTRGLKSLK